MNKRKLTGIIMWLFGIAWLLGDVYLVSYILEILPEEGWYVGANLFATIVIFVLLMCVGIFIGTKSMDYFDN